MDQKPSQNRGPTQIRERAGLEESRINQEFVDFLRSPWFTAFCVLLCIVAVVYAGRGQLKKREDARVAQAFSELNSATGTENPSPASLERVAEEFGTVRGVGMLATLAAADAHMNVVRLGIKPSATLSPDGTIASADDALTEEERASHLQQAETQYKSVLTQVQGDKGKLLQSLSATYGLAAVAECRRDAEAATKYYQQIEEMTKGGPFDVHGEIARERLAKLATFASADSAKLISKSSIPWAFPPAPKVEIPAAIPTGPAGPQAPEGAALAPATEAPKADPAAVPTTEAPASTPAAPAVTPAPAAPAAEPSATPK
jgi:hypothetical protein